eukprot:1833137-Pyramimonas_sp.AAC.1
MFTSNLTEAIDEGFGVHREVAEELLIRLLHLFQRALFIHLAAHSKSGQSRVTPSVSWGRFFPTENDHPRNNRIYYTTRSKGPQRSRSDGRPRRQHTSHGPATKAPTRTTGQGLSTGRPGTPQEDGEAPQC